MPKVKVYENFGSVIVEYPNNRVKSFLPNSGLSASADGDDVTITYNSQNLVSGLDRLSVVSSDGVAIAPTAAGCVSILNDLFENDNPSDIASESQLDNVIRLVKKISQEDDDDNGGSEDGDGDSGGGGDVWVISVDGEADSGVVKVRENSGLMSVGQSEIFVDDGKVKLSVRSNTGNVGSETKSEAIVITGQESSTGTVVDMKGSMKLSSSAESKFSMVNTDNGNGRTNYTGSQSYITLPSGADYSNNLMVGKSVVIGNADDDINRGVRNYFDVKGLSTGDVVDVTVKAVIGCDQVHTLVLDENRTTTDGSTFTDSTGQSEVTVSKSNTVDNYSDIRYNLNLTTVGSGTYRVKEITVTIS